MKQILLFLLILTASSAVTSQKLPDNFESKYDKFKDRTTISRKDSIIMGKGHPRVGAVVFQPYLFFQGTELRAESDASFGFLFESRSRMCQGYCFIRSHRLILLADNERIDLGEGNWEGTSGKEFIYYQVERPMLEKMVEAKVVEFQLGIFESKFAENDRTSIREILKLGTIKK